MWRRQVGCAAVRGAPSLCGTGMSAASRCARSGEMQSRSPAVLATSSRVLAAQACGLTRIRSYCVPAPFGDCGDGTGHMERRKVRLVHQNSFTRPEHFKEYEEHGIDAEILHNPAFNKATAFTEKERDILHVRGLLPPVVETIETQCRRVLAHLRSFSVPINKYVYLDSLRERNQTLFYRILVDNLEETMPLVYTPTVGEACQKFGQNFRTCAGMYFCPKDKGHMREMLDNWPGKEVDIIVVTDGSRILGLGDLGANGMGIPIGKLSLYVAAGGFHPMKTLPILFDTGTNNEANLSDPLYLGTRSHRLPNEEYYPLMEEFLMAVKDKWPRALLQFEDFSNDHCFDLLEKYRNRLRCFNDDIQGTGAVVASGYLNASRLQKTPLKDQRLVFLGAGSAGIGVADGIVTTMLQEDPSITPEEARAKFWFVDSRGLVSAKRGDKLETHKLLYARHDVEIQLPTLLDVVKYVKPTALIGLAGIQGGVFTPEIIKEMAQHAEKPIIFALSNPTSKAECTAHDAYTYTDGKAIYASGSPFDPVELGGKIHYPGQGNNMFIFPGLGLGSILCQATKVTDGMISAAARALSSCVTEEETAQGRIYPRLNRIRDISAEVASRVIEQAYEEGVAQVERPADIRAFVKNSMYYPEYVEMQ